MATLTRWDPFREMDSVRNMMEQLINDDRWSNRSWGEENSGAFNLALDVSEADDEFTVKASVPGVDADDADISLNDNMLTIRGEMKDEREQGGAQGQYHLRERRYGAFRRTISLPTSINAEEADADFENGVLTLHLPKSAETKPPD
ncbi:MAG: Hsp20/alpha crystallin family protein [Caldilineaceae bacterium]